MQNRRKFLFGTAAVVGTAAVAGGTWWRMSSGTAPGDFAVSFSDAEWRARLTEMEYAVLRKSRTEQPFSSPLNEIYDPGMYACVGCDNAVYDGAHKFDSKTGWPSFTQAVAGAVGERPDPKILGLADEAFCGRCGSHLGHVFEDGPEPTGLRHCINGVALTFTPATA